MTGTIAQILTNTLISALVLSLVAVGFTFIFRVTKVFHLAHAGIYVTGAFTCWWVLSKTDNWFLATLTSLAIVTGVIYLVEKSIYLPLSQRNADQGISLVSSMGLYVVLVNTLALLFGNDNKTFQTEISGAIELGSVLVTNVQLIQTIVAFLAIAGFLVFLKATGSELPLRAIADNELTSRVIGINTQRQRLNVLVGGSLLAAIGGILRTLDVGIDPQAGMSVTLTAAVVTILVSRLNVPLIVLFAFGLSLLQNCVEWVSNAQWRDGVTFALLLVVILFRTEGVISYNLREDVT